jgi:hypothetical protein
MASLMAWMKGKNLALSLVERKELMMGIVKEKLLDSH